MGIRVARRSDAAGIARVHAVTWQRAYATLLPASYLRSLSPRALSRRWARSIDRGTLVAEDEEGIAGFLQHGHARAGGRRVAEITMLYVHPRAQGMGFGSELVAESFRRLERAGAYWVHVWVLRDNRSARSFYRRHGLRFDGATRWDEFHGTQVAVARHARGLNRVWDLALRE